MDLVIEQRGFIEKLSRVYDQISVRLYKKSVEVIVGRCHDYVVDLVKENEVELFLDFVYFLAQYSYDLKEYNKSVFFSYQGILICNYVFKMERKL
jgi:hypothetical protein